jgi:hypothetical protein
VARTRSKKNAAREDRITMEIVVDAYDAPERAMGWYCYLQEHLQFPFTATCTAKRAVSPLKVKDEVKVIDMPGDEECQHEVFVTILWGDDDEEGLAVPLSQLKPAKGTDADTKQAVEDWLYWVEMGYEF